MALDSVTFDVHFSDDFLQLIDTDALHRWVYQAIQLEIPWIARDLAHACRIRVPVDTGRLRGSLRPVWAISRGGGLVSVHGVFYWPFVDNNGGIMVRRALRARRLAYVKRLEHAILGAIEEYFLQ